MRITAGQKQYGFGKCKVCRRVKPLADFRQWERNGKTHRSGKCADCEPSVEPINGVAPYVPLALRSLSWLRKNEIIRDAKRKPCADCGRIFDPECMDFDHKPGFSKSFNVSQMRDYKEDTIKEEIAKCDVVCCCCHRMRTKRRGYVGTGRKKKIIAPNLIIFDKLNSPQVEDW